MDRPNIANKYDIENYTVAILQPPKLTVQKHYYLIAAHCALRCTIIIRVRNTEQTTHRTHLPYIHHSHLLHIYIGKAFQSSKTSRTMICAVFACGTHSRSHFRIVSNSDVRLFRGKWCWASVSCTAGRLAVGSVLIVRCLARGSARFYSRSEISISVISISYLNLIWVWMPCNSAQ